MKDSGIEWIGEIPKGWTVESSKGVFVARKERARKDDVMLTASQRFGMIPQERYDDAVSYKTVKVIKGEDILKHVEPGDFVISMRSFQGGLEYSEYRGKMSSAYLALYPRQGWPIADGYYKYLFKSHRYIQSLQRTSNLVRDGQALRYANFIQVPIPYPPLCEQQRIADYLDERCAAIDEVRRTIEDEVEALQRLRKATIHRAVTKGLDEGVPMRDSGVDWIGEIPNPWTTIPLKHICTFGKGLPITKADLVDEGLPVVSYGQIHSKKNMGTALTSEICRHVEEKWLRTNKSALASKDDFLFADTSEDYEGLGNCAFVDTDDLVFAGYHTIIARPHGYSCPKYLAYLFKTDCWRKQIREKASGVKVFSATQSIFKRVSVLVPTSSEQQRIVDYLDERCGAIDSVIDTRTKQLERLEDYRRALIFAYVTGKKEVPSHE